MIFSWAVHDQHARTRNRNDRHLQGLNFNSRRQTAEKTSGPWRTLDEGGSMDGRRRCRQSFGAGQDCSTMTKESSWTCQ